jgi:beta-N-acetylhexosaminidase
MLGPVVVDLAGKRMTDQERERLRHPLVGGVILFSRNFESCDQLAELTAEIRAVRDPPLLISVDHEGGRVQRFRKGFTVMPAMAELGRLWETDVLGACRTATATGYVLASELRAHGVDFSYTPVVDPDWKRSEVIGNRSFHPDPRVVTLLANHLCHGLHMAGMSNCGKHFPSHGWAFADSHHVLPRDERPLEDILATDAAPYKWMGVSLASVMCAHIVYETVDTQPAGFSRRWIQEILRGQLGYTGLVFSDDLSMAGARVVGDPLQRAQGAIDAGCDVILVCNDAAAAEATLSGLKWKRTKEFDERLALIMPRGPAPTRAGLADDVFYREALAQVDAWLRTLAPKEPQARSM